MGLIHVVRAWLDGHADSGAGSAAERPAPASWLTGLRDPMVAQALAALHERPDRGWTLESLAAVVHTSRATLARRFTAQVGEPPLAYLTRWRMEVAAARLRTTTLPAAVIAREVGYASEYAFNRTFSRLCGSPPGRYRQTYGGRPGPFA